MTDAAADTTDDRGRRTDSDLDDTGGSSASGAGASDAGASGADDTSDVGDVDASDAGDTSASEAAPAATHASGGGRSWLPWVLAVLCLTAAAVAATASVQLRDARSERDAVVAEDARRIDVGTAAGAFGEALLSYDHTDLDASTDAVLALATDDFAETYQTAFVQGVHPVIVQLEAVSTATIREVYLTEFGNSGQAKAIVVLDQVAESTAGTRRLTGTYLELEVVLVDGAWRIDEVTALAASSESLTAGVGDGGGASEDDAPASGDDADG